MYESPINTIITEMQVQTIKRAEEDVYRAVQNVHVDVDKEELLMALQYDRKQYEKGYNDGIRDFAKKLVEHYFYDLERLAIFDEDIINFADKMINS